MERPFTEGELTNAIRRAQAGKAPGLDQVANEFIHHMGPVARRSLLRLINASWAQGVVPSGWRDAEMVPVYKGDGKDPNVRKSYRPISLTSNLAKVMERMVTERLRYHLEGRGTGRARLSPEQAGYRTARSSEEQCCRIAASVHDGLVEGEHVLLIAVDASQAFDRMVKDRLYEKMARLGIAPAAVAWMRAFLTERKARVRVGSAVSAFHTMEEGCPQGTVAGPVAWTIFVDDVVEAVSRAGGGVSLYADDIAICLRGKDVRALYARGQRTMDGLHRWATQNGVQVSLEKTTTTLFSPSQPPARKPKLLYGGTPVKDTSSVRLLGLWLDADWSFSTHIAKAADRMERRMGVIRRISGSSWGAKRGCLRTTYLALVQSIADYSLHAFAPYVPPEALRRISALEKEAAMLIGGTVSRTRLTAIYGEANVVPLQRRTALRSAGMYERLRRLPPDNPARRTAEAPMPTPQAAGPGAGPANTVRALARRSWRGTALARYATRRA